jgi:hypothetical protein
VDFSCYGLRGQIFTHVDSKTGKNTVFAVTDIRRICDSTCQQQVMVSIDREDVEAVLRHRGIEDYRVLRAMATKRWLPLLFAHMPDGTFLLIDGSHTFVARAALGHKWANAYIVPQEMWCYYTVEGLPEATEEELANSWSGVP